MSSDVKLNFTTKDEENAFVAYVLINYLKNMGLIDDIICKNTKEELKKSCKEEWIDD
ncbi:MAG: hypothetical protein ACERKN_19400 [Velocimicrobium sp.]